MIYELGLRLYHNIGSIQPAHEFIPPETKWKGRRKNTTLSLKVMFGVFPQ